MDLGEGSQEFGKNLERVRRDMLMAARGKEIRAGGTRKREQRGGVMGVRIRIFVI